MSNLPPQSYHFLSPSAIHESTCFCTVSPAQCVIKFWIFANLIDKQCYLILVLTYIYLTMQVANQSYASFKSYLHLLFFNFPIYYWIVRLKFEFLFKIQKNFTYQGYWPFVILITILSWFLFNFDIACGISGMQFFNF